MHSSGTIIWNYYMIIWNYWQNNLLEFITRLYVFRAKGDIEKNVNWTSCDTAVATGNSSGLAVPSG